LPKTQGTADRAGNSQRRIGAFIARKMGEKPREPAGMSRRTNYVAANRPGGGKPGGAKPSHGFPAPRLHKTGKLGSGGKKLSGRRGSVSKDSGQAIRN